jgi:hypothetical protein
VAGRLLAAPTRRHRRAVFSGVIGVRPDEARKRRLGRSLSAYRPRRLRSRKPTRAAARRKAPCPQTTPAAGPRRALSQIPTQPLPAIQTVQPTIAPALPRPQNRVALVYLPSDQLARPGASRIGRLVYAGYWRRLLGRPGTVALRFLSMSRGINKN